MVTLAMSQLSRIDKRLHAETPDLGALRIGSLGDACQQAADFVSALYDLTDLIEVFAIRSWHSATAKNQSRVVYRDWLSPDVLIRRFPALEDVNLAQSSNIYIGVNPRSSYGLGGKRNVTRVRSVWCDIDDVTFAETESRLTKLGLPLPSIVVNSGHGIHAYWLLDEAYQVGNAQQAYCV